MPLPARRTRSRRGCEPASSSCSKARPIQAPPRRSCDRCSRPEGFTVGKDIFLGFAPERVNPGDSYFGTRNTPKIVGGVTPACRDLGTALYETIIDHVVPVSSPMVAEMAKLLENTFRQINVAFANEMALICERLGIDVWEVIDAAATKPFGFMPFYPGPGLGGPCIPIVPHYLAWKLKTIGYETRFIALAEEINAAMPEHVVDLVADALNDEAKALRGSRVLVLGATYKPDVADTRESPPLAVLERLLAEGSGRRLPRSLRVGNPGERTTRWRASRSMRPPCARLIVW